MLSTCNSLGCILEDNLGVDDAFMSSEFDFPGPGNDKLARVNSIFVWRW